LNAWTISEISEQIQHILYLVEHVHVFYAIHGVFSKVQKVLLEPKNILLHLINS
jgi:hypothetical protein